MFFFFFSSRRRHTRSLRDWSSDVCSSDLAANGRIDAAARDIAPTRGPEHAIRRRGATSTRSEERRVGKECRSRWWRCHLKKKKEPLPEALRRPRGVTSTPHGGRLTTKT